MRGLVRWIGTYGLAVVAWHVAWAQRPVSTPPGTDRALVTKYCVSCHGPKTRMGGVVLEGAIPERAGENAALWERVLRKVRSGQMPPPGLPRPDAKAAMAFVSRLENTLDTAARLNPDPGAPMPHRLNRVEYSNAIRDLLALDIQAGLALPVDESGNGFDNMADLLSMSPALLERYIATARKVSRLAIGDAAARPVEESFEKTSGARLQSSPEDLPFHSRAGISIRHYFPADAEFVIRVNLRGNGEGKAPSHEIRQPVSAGLHTVSAAFLKEFARAETVTPTGRRGPTAAPTASAPPAVLDLRLDWARLKLFEVPQRGNAPDVTSVVIAGPYNITGRGDTPSRRKIFVCRPGSAQEEDACAGRILSNLARNAFRRPANEADIRPLLRFYKAKRIDGGDFEQGIQEALEALLVSPDFLFRVERMPNGVLPGTPFRVNGFDLASRLSFFLWSSIPDEQLLKLAEEDKLKDPVVLKTQFQRMLADPRSSALMTNFGGQWLYLRTLENAKPDADVFTRFDDNLRQSFRRETELFLNRIFREDRSVLELLDADYSFVNERLADHYGIHNVYGPQFRKVSMSDPNRGGLMGQGSVLTVTSYPNRTSVVQRGKWVLENLLGAPPPPPPPDVPDLKPKSKDGRQLTMREAMEQHRTNAVCSSCHSRMDPIGFALENFDGIGTWRNEDHGAMIDSNGKLPDGAQVNGPAGLKKLLRTAYRDEFVETVTEKLLTYALGRGLEATDKPTVRAIVRKAANHEYRISAFLAAIVESTPFQMRRTPQ